ncbi:MAG: HAD-IIA family hydrolase [Promethearchaeota archaeon]
MLSSEQDLSEISKKKAFFIDLDGTVYLENKIFKGVHEFITRLKEHGKYYFFLSNNSSLSTTQYLKKLKNLKLDVSLDNIILSQHPTIDYLKKEGFKRIFLLGNSALKIEFQENGFQIDEEHPEVVVLAFDQELTYKRLLRASELLQEGLTYIATHLDNRCPTLNGYIPDAGAIASLLYRTTDRLPDKVMGKPNKGMLLFKLRDLNIPPEEAIMIGDRLYTDVRMGIEACVTTCCVLSGESTLELIKESKYKPDHVINGIWELVNLKYH